jgi:WD40 repeat protein
MALSPHGEYLAYIRARKLYIRNTADDKDLSGQEDNDNISCDGPMAFSEYGNALAYSDGKRIYIHARLEDGKFVKKAVFTGESARFTDLTFISDDQLLAATGEDGRIYFWDVNKRALFGVFDQPGIAQRFVNGKLQIYLPSERRLLQLDFEKGAWEALLNGWAINLCSKADRVLVEDEWQQVSTDPYPERPNCPMPKFTTYVIQDGDSLESIATASGIEVNVLIQDNSITDPNQIVPGQILKIRVSNTPVPP